MLEEKKNLDSIISFINVSWSSRAIYIQLNCFIFRTLTVLTIRTSFATSQPSSSRTAVTSIIRRQINLPSSCATIDSRISRCFCSATSTTSRIVSCSVSTHFKILPMTGSIHKVSHSLTLTSLNESFQPTFCLLRRSFESDFWNPLRERSAVCRCVRDVAEVWRSQRKSARKR